MANWNFKIRVCQPVFCHPCICFMCMFVFWVCSFDNECVVNRIVCVIWLNNIMRGHLLEMKEKERNVTSQFSLWIVFFVHTIQVSLVKVIQYWIIIICKTNNYSWKCLYPPYPPFVPVVAVLSLLGIDETNGKLRIFVFVT